ncbi:MAG: hypothetical protein ABL900_19575 [Burkholderiaceae bacterium]
MTASWPGSSAASGSRLVVGGRRGGIWIGTAALLSAVGSLIAQLAFERALGVDGFALWAYLLSLIGLLIPVACMGSNHFVLSEFYAGRLDTRGDAHRVLAYFGVFTAFALVTFLALNLRGARSLGLGSLWVAGLLFVAHVPVSLVYSIFLARAQTRWVALWPLAQVLMRTAVGCLAILVAWNYETAILAWTLACLTLASVATLQVWPSWRSRLGRSASAGASSWRRMLVPGIGFGLSDLFEALDLKLLVPLAALLFAAVETAAAGLAVVVLSAAFFFPHVLISRILLPAIHRSAEQSDRMAVRALFLRLCAWSLAVLLPASALTYVYGYQLIAFAVKGNYASQAGALSCLAFCLAPMCISQLAAAPHMERKRTWQLLRWRAEAVVLFVLLTMTWRAAGLTALLLSFALGRVWLCVRVLSGLRLRANWS